MPKRKQIVMWECEECNQPYPLKVQAENCEDSCRTRREFENIKNQEAKELMQKYFPRLGNSCGKCKKRKVVDEFLNMCKTCRKKEFKNLMENLKNKEYMIAFSCALAKYICYTNRYDKRRGYGFVWKE